ncbi:MAG TPA: alpha/beta hydrolase [Gaiellaceae bacterium]
MREVRTPDGRTLAVREGGDPAGVPMLVYHGTPGSSLFYEPHLRDAEKEGIRLFSYDRPGYGGSTRNKSRNVAACAEDAAAVCDVLGIERFCLWGISGGGPHALATAALLPDRVVAAAALAPVAPFEADGLDFFEGMGEQNIEDTQAVLESEEAHLAVLERERKEFLATAPDELVNVLETLLGPADREVLTGRIAAFLLENMRVGVKGTLDGWFDDDVAFTQPWGFDLDSIRVPVLHWQGEQDKFVPLGHGIWLSDHIPGVESHLSPEDGHLTLAERRVPEVHAWLLARFRA